MWNLCQILFPAMRLGFLVVPEAFREGLVSALSVTGQFPPLLTQAALADFINEGHFARHLRRMRRLYAARRQFFMEICEDRLGPWLRLRRSESGIQLVGLFHDSHDDKAVAEAARLHGVNVSPLSIQYRHGQAQRGLLMGFAAADEKATRKAWKSCAMYRMTMPSRSRWRGGPPRFVGYGQKLHCRRRKNIHDNAKIQITLGGNEMPRFGGRPP